MISFFKTMLLLCQCSLLLLNCTGVKKNLVLEVTNPDFLTHLTTFCQKSEYYSSESCEFVSVSISGGDRDTLIGLYANKFLGKEYYVGQAKINNLKLYFYSTLEGDIKCLYKSRKGDGAAEINEEDSLEVYNESYTFTNCSMNLIKFDVDTVYSYPKR